MTEQVVEDFYLTEIIGAKIVLKNKTIGSLADFIIKENGKFPHITDLYISRPFGIASLIVPWDSVSSINKKEIVIGIDHIETYERKLLEHEVLLKDYVLDKKIIDLKGREVEVVYDVRLLLKDNKLYVVDVDLSKNRMLNRLGLKKLAGFLQYVAGKMRNQQVSWEYIQQLPTDIDRFKGDIQLNILKEKLSGIHPADLADILEELNDKQRARILNILDIKHASEILEEINPNVQRHLIETIAPEKINQLLSFMTTGQIADVLKALPHSQVNFFLESLPEEQVKKVKAILDKQDEEIINLTTDKIIICSPDKSVTQAQEEYYLLAKNKDVVMYLYITNEHNYLTGILDIKELLKAHEKALLKDIMTKQVITLSPKDTYSEAAELFEKYNFRSIPVVDSQNILLGAVTYKDLVGLKHKFID
jgi:CBS domain-containing protein